MDISRKTDYALRILSVLVEGGDGLLSVRTAADQVNVPYSFARSIQHGLVQAGIVESLRGVHGGMRLKVDPAEVTIKQVVEAVQGPFVMNDCCAAKKEIRNSFILSAFEFHLRKAWRELPAALAH